MKDGWILARWEARIEGLFENFFGKRISLETIVREIAYALEDYRYNRPLMSLKVYLHPTDYMAVKEAYPHLESQLLAHVVELGRQMGLMLLPQPQLEVQPRARQARGTLGVAIDLPHSDPISTAKLKRVVSNDDTTLPSTMPDAQLLRNGQSLIRLDRPIINLGRSADNHLVIDEPNVSRHHCQIRWRHGKFMMFDLNSLHGLYVNQQRVREHLLQNGDVISVGSVQLLFLLDETSQRLTLAGDTQPQPPEFGS